MKCLYLPERPAGGWQGRSERCQYVQRVAKPTHGPHVRLLMLMLNEAYATTSARRPERSAGHKTSRTQRDYDRKDWTLPWRYKTAFHDVRFLLSTCVVYCPSGQMHENVEMYVPCLVTLLVDASKLKRAASIQEATVLCLKDATS